MEMMEVKHNNTMLEGMHSVMPYTMPEEIMSTNLGHWWTICMQGNEFG